MPDEEGQDNPNTQSSSIKLIDEDEHRIHHDKAANSGEHAITDLAEDFARVLPDSTFSPAEIQGFLLGRKTDPAKAVVDVLAWRDEQLQNRSESAAQEIGNGVIFAGHEGGTRTQSLSGPHGGIEGLASATANGTTDKVSKKSSNAEVNGSITSRGGKPGLSSSAQPGICNLNTGSPGIDASALQVHQNNTAAVREPSSDADDDGSKNDESDTSCPDGDSPSDDDEVQENGGDHCASQNGASDDDEDRSTMHTWSDAHRAGGSRIIFGSGHRL